MNRIILAYASANADLAQRIDHQLSRIGIPFEHISSSSGNLMAAILAAGEPVLLLVTENLLTDRVAMGGLLEGLQRFPSEIMLLPVVADGVDANGQPVVTHIDRMVNMLHFMNHWQNQWLDLSAVYQAADSKQKAVLEPELDAVRAIANETSDVITALRARGAVEMDTFESHDYALFFQKFNLGDWHGQYRRLAAQQADNQLDIEPVHLPETPLSSGMLALEPVEELLPIEEELLHHQVTAAVEPTPAPVEAPVVPEPEEAPMVFEKTAAPVDLIEQTIQDAQFWIERGHTERGIELLKIAAEEYPDDERVTAAYQKAKPAEIAQVTTISEPETIAAPETPVTENDANSYAMMGDMAHEKGDYLFAKYCWDRVAEVEPGYAGIYRKLGLMTAEHLLDYRETAVHYLKKALESDADDTEVKAVLAELTGAAEPTPEVTAQPVVNIPVQAPEADTPVVETIPVLEPEAPVVAPGTILITGATSGIGRATAEIFAKNGYRLILTGRRIDRLVELKNHLETTYHVESILLPFDVRDSGAVKAALDNLPASFQEIDILVNNAGLAKGLAPIQEGNLDHWEQMIDTNVKGLLYVTRCIAPGMVARKRGHIINLGSSAGKEVYPNGNVYCATKFAVDALTRAIRLDLHAHNIRVSQVSPGHVEETEFAITRFDGDAERAKIYNDFQPLKSSDVAEVIYFMVTRPAHVNIQDVQMFGTQQASSTVVDRSGR
jgi:NADP-dependent 3-hydroxy acid dehydrogenase YdfG